jgi:deazaflavin-dependent oxidoreductase (nitroreductase family)
VSGAVEPALAEHDYCYLTTTGRVSGRPREIEIWFGLAGDTAYLLSGGGERSHWVRNLRREPAVTLRIADVTFAGRARVVEDPGEQARARALLYDKYRSRYAGSLERWRDTAAPVAIELRALTGPDR